MYFYCGKYLVGEWKGSHVHASMHQTDQYTYPFSTKLLCVGIIICPSKAIVLVFRAAFQCHSSSFVDCNLSSSSVHKGPWQKAFTLGHYLTITSSKDGNSKEWLPEQKLVSFGKQSSFKYVNWAKVITSLASPPYYYLCYPFTFTDTFSWVVPYFSLLRCK